MFLDSATQMVFRQSSAPLGWTKVTSYHNYGLRITSGTAGTKSGSGFTSVLASRSMTISNTTLTTSSMASHSHYIINRLHNNASSSYDGNRFTCMSPAKTVGWGMLVTSLTRGSSGAHNHSGSVGLNVKYLDVILAVKQ